jgi:hypothetical protein
LPSQVLGWVRCGKCFSQSFNNSECGQGGNVVPDKEGLPSLIYGSWLMVNGLWLLVAIGGALGGLITSLSPPHLLAAPRLPASENSLNLAQNDNININKTIRLNVGLTIKKYWNKFSQLNTTLKQLKNQVVTEFD